MASDFHVGSGSCLSSFIETIGRYQIAAALNGFYLRGAATVGNLIHDTACVFGPALIRAYELESKEAKFPRIILDPDAPELNALRKHVRVTEGYTTIDVFGVGFVRDCLTPTISSVHTSSPGLPHDRNEVPGRTTFIPGAPLRIILNKVQSSLDETTNPRAREKLHWLKAEVEAGLKSLADPS